MAFAILPIALGIFVLGLTNIQSVVAYSAEGAGVHGIQSSKDKTQAAQWQIYRQACYSSAARLPGATGSIPVQMPTGVQIPAGSDCRAEIAAGGPQRAVFVTLPPGTGVAGRINESGGASGWARAVVPVSTTGTTGTTGQPGGQPQSQPVTSEVMNLVTNRKAALPFMVPGGALVASTLLAQ